MSIARDTRHIDTIIELGAVAYQKLEDGTDIELILPYIPYLPLTIGIPLKDAIRLYQPDTTGRILVSGKVKQGTTDMTILVWLACCDYLESETPIEVPMLTMIPMAMHWSWETPGDQDMIGW